MVDSDDQTICNHVRDALVSLDIALGEMELARRSWREKSNCWNDFSDSVKLIQDASEDDFNTSAACRKIWNEAENMRCLLPTKGEK